MNKALTILVFLMIVQSAQATFPEDLEVAKKLTPFELKQIERSIEVLTKYKVLSYNENKCLDFEPSILNQLELAGLLKKERDQTPWMSICIGYAEK